MALKREAYILIFAALLLRQGTLLPQSEKRPMTFDDVLKVRRLG